MDGFFKITLINDSHKYVYIISKYTDTDQSLVHQLYDETLILWGRERTLYMNVFIRPLKFKKKNDNYRLTESAYRNSIIKSSSIYNIVEDIFKRDVLKVVNYKYTKQDESFWFEILKSFYESYLNISYQSHTPCIIILQFSNE